MTNPYAQSTAAEREQLIVDHLPQVRWIAAHIHERLSRTTSEDDLVQTGVLGLIAAVDTFDPQRNASLKTYAEYRIRGAILDSIRGLDGIAPHKRKRLKQVQDAIQSIQQRKQGIAEEEEIAAELGLSLAEYHEWLVDLQGIALGTLEAVADGGSVDLLRYIADDSAEGPAEAMERTELQRLLARGIEILPEIERTVLALYFDEELTLSEVGQVVDLHTSRVCQIKSQAIARLRAYLRRQWK